MREKPTTSFMQFWSWCHSYLKPSTTGCFLLYPQGWLCEGVGGQAEACTPRSMLSRAAEGWSTSSILGQPSQAITLKNKALPARLCSGLCSKHTADKGATLTGLLQCDGWLNGSLLRLLSTHRPGPLLLKMKLWDLDKIPTMGNTVPSV